MMPLAIRPANDCGFDVVSLGEVMLRLDPGEGRIRTARTFRAWEGGGEYNVARGLRRAFGMRTAIVTGLVRNEVGLLLEDLILQGGVDPRWIVWREDDGVGRRTRNGLNFTERGFGVRGAVGTSDRGHTATASLRPGEVDWDHVFGTVGCRWLHTGGIFAALSENAAQVALEAVTAAARQGVVVSYDLNYRPSLWKGIGGQARAQEVNASLAPYIDVMIGNEEDFSAALGFTVAGVDESLTDLPVAAFADMIEEVVATYPRLRVVATTLRTVHTASDNSWSAIAWSPDTGVVEATPRPHLEILDRVGGGDSFASGLIYGLLQSMSVQEALEYGAAHGALAMTTPGDTSMASLAEVAALVKGGGARVQR
ncbi:MAG: sugar kinase [Phycicoccus sp.]|nr:sugar kinase [Phycicoccus sp.]